MSPPPADPVGLYVHVPFCARACPYCDFDFDVVGRPPVERYLAGLVAELGARVGGFARPAVDTVYVGGGTPSQLGAEGLGSLLELICSRFDTEPCREFTVELNPEHVSPHLMSALRARGVTRVSLGVQTFDPEGLRQLGRVHDRASAVSAINIAKSSGCDVTCDLILGWPGQEAPSIEEDVGRLVDLGVEHVSAYALTIEPATAWEGLVRRGLRVLPDADAQTDRLLDAERTLVQAGFDHYEVSSYARPGAQATHNLKYWTWADYIGLGPSAASASFVDGGVVRRTNIRGFEAWLDEPGGAAHSETLAPQNAASEALWTGLRRLQGVDLGAFLRRFPVGRVWVEDRVERQLAIGNLVWGPEDRLFVAPGRWLFHDAIAVDLMA